MNEGNGIGRTKILLIVTSMAFAIWIAGMLAMYFKTAHPVRHPQAHSLDTK
jgi:hypothetical protein